MNQITKASSLPPESTERLAVFVDGANLYAASRTLGFDVDYKKLLAHFWQRSYLVRAYYYTALLETEEYSPLRPLVTGSATTATRWSPSRPRSSPMPPGAAG